MATIVVFFYLKTNFNEKSEQLIHSHKNFTGDGASHC